MRRLFDASVLVAAFSREAASAAALTLLTNGAGRQVVNYFEGVDLITHHAMLNRLYPGPTKVLLDHAEATVRGVFSR